VSVRCSANMARETLGGRVRRARVEAGLGLRELARRLGKTPSYLSDIENDRRVPSEEVLRALSRELPVEFDELMGLAGRFGEDAERYLKRSPAAAKLFRRISASRLGEQDLAELLQKAEQLSRKKGTKR
jgi:transcriptional regulator with XRE-family HTH domain